MSRRDLKREIERLLSDSFSPGSGSDRKDASDRGLTDRQREHIASLYSDGMEGLEAAEERSKQRERAGPRLDLFVVRELVLFL